MLVPILSSIGREVGEIAFFLAMDLGGVEFLYASLVPGVSCADVRTRTHIEELRILI